MRFIKMFLKYLVLGLVVIPTVGFIVINVLVYIQAVSVADALSTAKKLSIRPTHVKDCVSAETNFDEVALYGYQVRFIDDREYVIEAVCKTDKGPFEVKTGILDFGVKKAPGFSGIVFPLSKESPVEGRLVLQMYFAKWMVEVGDMANMAINLVTDVNKVEPGKNAASATCVGWGYRCCDFLTEVGQNEVRNESIMDCAGNCYKSCLSRPSILIFTCDPEFSSQKDRVLDISKKEPLVVFSYSVDDIDSEAMEVSIDFGDGEEAVSSNQTDQFSHTYGCEKQVCVYEASLEVVDDMGLENARSRISTITVRVK